MSLSFAMQLYNFYWSVKSNHHQELAWQDAAEARIARARAEAQAAAQLQTMLEANPTGQLGNAKLDDEEALKVSGLL